MKSYWMAAVVMAGSAMAQEPVGATVTQENGALGVKVAMPAVRPGGVVTGSPYSAVAVTENIQTLADGNRIVQNQSQKLYRDGQGRERTEQALPKESGITAVISDPVAKTGFSLNSDSRMARQTPPGVFLNMPVYSAAGAADKLYVSTTGEALAGAVAGLQTGGGRGAAVYVGPGPGGRGGRGPAAAKTDANTVTEELPAQNIEGVYATGKRVTRTIPAGQIGNDKPIVTVEEVWYSPDLQMNVLTKHSDPRTGENTYRLTNISRAEPDPSLFQVPADYTVIPARK